MQAKSRQDLERELENLARDYCEQCPAIGYRPGLFRQMLNQHGAFESIKRLINKPIPSDGFATLWEKGRLDLSMEALILENPQFHCLFTDEELETARKWLKQYNYEVKIKN